jgi:hypothetical protein
VDWWVGGMVDFVILSAAKDLITDERFAVIQTAHR